MEGGPKSEATNSWPYFCQILTDFRNFFSLEDFFVNLQISRYYKSNHTLHMLPHSPWNVNVRKQATNDKLQGSVVVLHI